MKTFSIFCVGLFVCCAESFVIYPQHMRGRRGWPGVSTWSHRSRFSQPQILSQGFGMHQFGNPWSHGINYGYGHPLFQQRRFNFGPFPSISNSRGFTQRGLHQPLQIRSLGGRTIRLGSRSLPVRQRLVSRRRQIHRPVVPSRIVGGIPTLSEFRSGPQVSRRRITRERISKVYKGNGKGDDKTSRRAASSSTRRRVLRPDAAGINSNEVMAIFALDQPRALAPTVSKETQHSDIKLDDIHAAAAKAAIAGPSALEAGVEKITAKSIKGAVSSLDSIDFKKTKDVAYNIADVAAVQSESVSIDSLSSTDETKTALKAVVKADVAKVVAPIASEIVHSATIGDAIPVEAKIVSDASAVADTIVKGEAPSIEVAAPTIEVAAPIIQIEAPIIKVEAPKVFTASEVNVNINDAENANAEIVVSDPVSVIEEVPLVVEAAVVVPIQEGELVVTQDIPAKSEMIVKGNVAIEGAGIPVISKVTTEEKHTSVVADAAVKVGVAKVASTVAHAVVPVVAQADSPFHT